MSTRATSATSAVVEASVGTPLEIHVAGRWNALALSELLIPFHSFLVQHSPERWVVHARAPGYHSESLADALDAIKEWHAERGMDTSVRVDGRPYGFR